MQDAARKSSSARAIVQVATRFQARVDSLAPISPTTELLHQQRRYAKKSSDHQECRPVRSRGNELEAELLELVRRGGIDLHCESGDVIGIPLLDDAGQLVRGGLLDLLEIETAGHAPEIHLLVDARFRIVFLEELLEFIALTAVEDLEPVGELTAGGCVRSLGRLGREQAAQGGQR